MKSFGFDWSWQIPGFSCLEACLSHSACCTPHGYTFCTCKGGSHSPVVELGQALCHSLVHRMWQLRVCLFPCLSLLCAPHSGTSHWSRPVRFKIKRENKETSLERQKYTYQPVLWLNLHFGPFVFGLTDMHFWSSYNTVTYPPSMAFSKLSLT